MELKGTNQIAKTRLGSMLYNIHDTRIGRALQTYGEWGESEFEVFSQILKPGDVVVDAGAYIGTHTVYFSQAVGKGGVVHSFEPQHIPFQILCGNVSLNSQSNVLPQQLALGEKKRSVKVPRIDYSKPGDFASYSASYVPKTGEQSDSVPIIPLDEYDLDRCKLLKVDVDGDELSILLGSKAFLQRTRAIVFVENNNAATSAKLIELLAGLNYSMYWHLDFAYRKGNFAHHEGDIFDGAFDVNILALPSELQSNLKNFTPVTGPSDTWQSALERSKA